MNITPDRSEATVCWTTTAIAGSSNSWRTTRYETTRSPNSDAQQSVIRWRSSGPRTFECFVHAGKRRVGCGGTGPHGVLCATCRLGERLGRQFAGGARMLASSSRSPACSPALPIPQLAVHRKPPHTHRSRRTNTPPPLTPHAPTQAALTRPQELPEPPTPSRLPNSSGSRRILLRSSSSVLHRGQSGTVPNVLRWRRIRCHPVSVTGRRAQRSPSS